jgi:glycosyltransferase involved in cell wall biosynthesis
VRIVINDHLGHAPQMQLSRALAARGHQVLHIYSSDVQSPKADLQRGPGDDNLQIEGLVQGQRPANTFLGSRLAERRFGRMVARTAMAFRPNVVVGCNNPLDVQSELQSACRSSSVPFIYWMQDFQAVRIDQQIAHWNTAANATVGAYYHSLERKLLQRSDVVIAVADDHLGILAETWDVFARQCMVVRNWSPLEAVTPGDKDNAWSRAHGLAGKKIALYAGSLVPMENPSTLLAMARHLGERSDVSIVVVSEGSGAEQLKAQAASQPQLNLTMLPFQPYEAYGQVLASADVLLGLVAAEAGVLFVPSKVNSYLCAGRPIVLSAPWQNLAAQTIHESGGGQVVPPGDPLALAQAITGLLDDEALIRQMGECARRYAENAFDIGPIANRFERLFQRLQEGPTRRRERSHSMPVLNPTPPAQGS